MSGVSTNAPVASKHLFLHQVATEPIGAKVRFLCCVLNYEVAKALLHVEHRCLQDAAQNLNAAVEITQVLKSVKSTDIQAGSWLNVIGYVRRSLPRKNERKKADELASILVPQVVVQAVLIWNAGSVKSSDYERILTHQQEVERLALETMPERLQS